MKNRLRIGLGLSSALLASLLISKPVYAEGYKASNAEKTLKIVNLNDLEGQVKASMDKGAFGYIRGGAEDEQNLRNNTSSFDKKYIMPLALQGIEFSDLDLKTQLLGIPLSTPIIQAPMAAQGLAHEQGEIATAKGMAKSGSIFSLSTYGNKTIEEVAAASDNPYFFQFYMSKSEKFNEFTLNDSHMEKNRESLSPKKGLKSTKITGGLPGTFHLPILTLSCSFVRAYSFHSAKRFLSSMKSTAGSCSHISGPINMALSSKIFLRLNALVDKTVYIPPTLLQTSQLLSNK